MLSSLDKIIDLLLITFEKIKGKNTLRVDDL